MNAHLSPNSPRRRNIRAILILNLSILLISVLYFIIFNLTKDTPSEFTCFVKETFGFYCPGCGGSRSLSALLTLDFLNSFRLYPPILICAAVILVHDIILIIHAVKNTEYSGKYLIFIVVAVSVILNFIIRNILLYFGIDTIGDFSVMPIS